MVDHPDQHHDDDEDDEDEVEEEPPAPVIVGGHRYKASGAASEIFRLAFALPSFRQADDPEMLARSEAKIDEFIAAVPDWVAYDMVLICEELIGRLRAARPDDTPPPPAVDVTGGDSGSLELWGPCDDLTCPNEHLHEEGDCRRCRLPDDHRLVVQMRKDHAAAQNAGGG